MSKLKSVIDFMTKLKADAADIAENFGKEIDAIQNDPAYQGCNIGASVAIAKYADHVAAELQAENAALRAKVEELESEQSFKNGMKDLLLQAMDSKSEMPIYPVDLETEDGSFIKAVIAIKIQSVGVAK